MDPRQNSTKMQEAADRLRQGERSQFGFPGALGSDASAEKSVVCQSVVEEASNKILLGQSCHITRHARL